MPWPLDDKPVSPVANALMGNVIGFPQGGAPGNAMATPSKEFTVGGGYGGGASAANARTFYLTDSGGHQAYATFQASSPEEFRRQFASALNQAEATKIPYLRGTDYRLAFDVEGLAPYIKDGPPRMIRDQVRHEGQIANPNSSVSIAPRFMSADEANKVWDHTNKTAANIMDFDRAMSGMSSFAAEQPKSADVVELPRSNNALSERATGAGILGRALTGGGLPPRPGRTNQ